VDVVEAPAICDTCGTIFGSGFAFGPGASATMIGGKAGPCPNCGGEGSLPDGFYEFVGEALNIVSSWPADRIRGLDEALREAKSAPNPRAAAEAAIAKNPDLLGIASKLLIPRDPAQFWAFIATLIALLTLLGVNQPDPTIKVDVQMIIDRASGQPAVPQQGR
jgi:hypothetical protein